MRILMVIFPMRVYSWLYAMRVLFPLFSMRVCNCLCLCEYGHVTCVLFKIGYEVHVCHVWFHSEAGADQRAILYGLFFYSQI